MRITWKQLGEPFNSISEQPYQFLAWWVVANFIGLAGFWVPILVSWARNMGASGAFFTSVRAGSLASFSVVLLAEGIAAALVALQSGSNKVAAGMRGLVSVLALVVVIIQAVLLAAQSAIEGGALAPNLQVLLTGVAVFLAIYLYCFRFVSWEKGVEAVQVADDKAVQDLASAAQKTTADDSGVKL